MRPRLPCVYVVLPLHHHCDSHTLTSTPTQTVAVLGAGAMGAASVRALVAKSVPTVVYNRSPGRLEPLVADLGDAVTTTVSWTCEINAAGAESSRGRFRVGRRRSVAEHS